MKTSNAELLRRTYPNVVYVPTNGANETLFSIEKARRELGFIPKFDHVFT